MSTDIGKLPPLVRCPGCQQELNLSGEEQLAGKFICPSCAAAVDVDTVEGGRDQLLPYVVGPYPASTGKRLANLLIDNFIASVANAISLGTISSLSVTLFGEESIIFVFLAALVLPFLYYFAAETSFQKTPAKYITRTKVINEDGSRPDGITILKRTLSRFVPFEVFSGSEGSWWHDRWTGTMVVDD